MTRQFRVMPWVAFSIALLLSFAYLFIGLGLINDQFYWLFLCKNYRSSPMSVGTLWLGHIWGSLFSYSLISFRILKWIIELLSLFFACRIAKFNRNGFTVYLSALALLLIGYGWQNEYSPTVLTNLCIVLIVYAFSLYMTKWSTASLIIMALFTGVSAVVRFPNIMAVPIMALSIIVYGIGKGEKIICIIKHVVLFLGTSLAVWWFATAALLMTPTPISSLRASISSVAQGAHSFESLLNGYLWDFSSFWGLMTTSFFFGMTMVVYRGGTSGKWKVFVCICSVILFGLFFLKTVGFHKWVNMQLLQFLSASILMLLIVGIYLSVLNKNVSRGVLYLCVLMLSFVPTMGSDTRYMKLFPLTLYFLPFLWQSVVGIRKDDRYLLPTCAELVFCAMLCFWGNPNASSEKSIPLWTCTEKDSSSSLAPVRISKGEMEWVQAISKAVDTYEGPKVSYGFASFFLNYVSRGKISLASSNFGDQIMNENDYFEQQFPHLQDNKFIFICTMKPSLFEQKLVDEGYIMREKNALFKVYSL